MRQGLCQTLGEMEMKDCPHSPPSPDEESSGQKNSYTIMGLSSTGDKRKTLREHRQEISLLKIIIPMKCT